ncbi:MAG TPA: alpha/beta hydrolase [Symbiobacteriaceae bacterium]|nr:alpha/beta hydrolase [Symbiobacteriaceae bacterium]
MHWHRQTPPPIPYEESGDGFPVLFVHGRLNDSRLWAPVANLLSGRYRTIRCDMRPPGKPHSPSAADNAVKVLDLLNWLGLSRAHLISHGAGWSWAAGMAVQSPGRVMSLTVVDPVVPRTEQTNAIQEAWHLEMLLQWLSVSHGTSVRKPEHATALAAVVAQQTHARIADGEDPISAPAYGTEMPPLEGVRCPVLALVGQDATAESKALVASVFGQAHQFQLCQVAGATRHCPVEAPRSVADHLERFLATCR